MTNSVVTNPGQMVALRNLNYTSDALFQTNKRISSGLKVMDAYDDGGSFAVAVSLRSDIGVIGAVNERLAVGKGMVDVAIKASEHVSRSLREIREVLTKLADMGLTGSDRTNYVNQYNSLISEVDSYIRDARYNNVTLVNGTQNQSIIATMDGTGITITAHDLSRSVTDVLLSSDVSSATAAAAMIASSGTFLNIETAVGKALNSLASDARRIVSHINFNSAIMDAHASGLGYIVDADLHKESALLQSLQVKQQLSTQSLSIANQQPRALLNVLS